MNKNIILFFIVLSSYLTNAQIGGKYAYQFLNLTTSPRMAALGGKNITNFDYDPTQALVNPAAINPSMSSLLSSKSTSLCK